MKQYVQSRSTSLLVGEGYICLKWLLGEIQNFTSRISFDIWIFQNESDPDISWAMKAQGACSLQQLITVSQYSYCHNCFLSPLPVFYNTAKYKLAVLEPSSETLLTSPASGLLLKSTGRQKLGSSSSLPAKIELLIVSFLVQVQQNYWT